MAAAVRQQDESRAISHARDKQHADFLADVKVRVRDTHGHDTMKATSDGPFLLAKLPPGQYGIVASKAQSARVTLLEGVTNR